MAQSEYTVEAEGGILEISVKSNIDFTITTSDSWIQYIETRALSTKTLRFTITPNDSAEERFGYIHLVGKVVSQDIYVRQYGNNNTEGNIEDMPTQPWE